MGARLLLVIWCSFPRMGSFAHKHAKAPLNEPINRVRRGSVVTDTKKSVVLDRELEEEKPGESEPPRIRCPLCGWSRKEDKCSASAGTSGTHSTPGSMPCLPPSVD